MLNQTEENFIRRFIVKEKRDRMLYELNGKKRRDCIGRFSHGTAELLKHQKIIRSGKLSSDEIITAAERYQISGLWHLMAYHPEFDGISGTLPEVLKLTLGNGMPVIMISDRMAVIETEQSAGTPTRYILFDSEK